MVTKHQRAAAARARAARWPCTAQAISNSSVLPVSNAATVIEIDSDSEWDCGYTGGVNHRFSGTEYDSGTVSEWSGGSDSGEDSVELEGDELDANLQKLRKKAHAKALEAFPKYAQIGMKKSAFEWKKAEKTRALGYTGNSQRTQERREKEARDRAVIGEGAKSSKDPQILMMRNFFKATEGVAEQASAGHVPASGNLNTVPEPATEDQNLSDLVKYPSDLSNDEDDATINDIEAENSSHMGGYPGPSQRQPAVPQRKRQKLDVPYRVQREQQKQQQLEDAFQMLSQVHLTKHYYIW